MSSQTKTYQHFSEVPRVDIPRSSFDRSHGIKTTVNAGYLYPIYWDDVIPGDTINIKDHIFARLATPIVPMMDNLYLDLHYFFVPKRRLWTNMEKYWGANTSAWTNSNTYLVPIVTLTNEVTSLSLWDYLGVPPATDYTGVPVTNMAGRCYNKIFNDWYRDENVQSEIPGPPGGSGTPPGDGPDLPSDYVLRRRNKRKDYFTSGLPQPQKGPAVTLPLGTSAPIVGLNMPFDSTNAGNNRVNIRDASGNLKNLEAVGGSSVYGKNTAAGTGELIADLSDATAATINSLRMALQLQVLYERDARGGTRFVEVIKSHFGVTSPDYRLDRAEYLGGSTKNLTMTPIAQTASTDATSPQGNLAGYGVIAGNSGVIKQSFTEPGIFMVIASIRADLNYQQGLARKFSRRTRFEEYWPALANIGEQSILTKEIYCKGAASSATNDTVLSYQERYAEYRYNLNEISGLMRSDLVGATGSLDIWHLGQDFSAAPTLNEAFIMENPPIERVIAVPTEPHFILDGHFEERWERPMPTYGVPGLGTRF